MILNKNQNNSVGSSNQLDSASTPTNQGEAYYLRGQFFERKGEFALAIRDYQLALSLNPSLVNAAYAKAACESKIGKYEEAIVTYNQAFGIENSSDYGSGVNKLYMSSVPLSSSGLPMAGGDISSQY